MKWFRVRVTEDAGRESGRREPRTKDPNKREVDLMGGVNKRRHRCERPRSDGNKALARQNSKARHCSRLYPARLPVPHSLHLSLLVSVSLCCVQCLALLLGAESPKSSSRPVPRSPISHGFLFQARHLRRRQQRAGRPCTAQWGDPVSSKKWGHPFMRLHGRRRRPDKCTVRSWLASRVSFSP
jgi:hypothetical protein